jgi:hypothetical protein
LEKKLLIIRYNISKELFTHIFLVIEVALFDYPEGRGKHSLQNFCKKYNYGFLCWKTVIFNQGYGKDLK